MAMKTASLLTLLALIYLVLGQNVTSDNVTESDASSLETLEAGDSDSSLLMVDDTSVNVTSESELTDSENSTRTTKLSCSCNNTLEDNKEAVVQLVNGSMYQSLIYGEHNSSVTNRSQAALCSVTLFYAPWCDFSTAGNC